MPMFKKKTDLSMYKENNYDENRKTYPKMDNVLKNPPYSKPDENGEERFTFILRLCPSLGNEEKPFIENSTHWVRSLDGKNISYECFRNKNKDYDCPFCKQRNLAWEHTNCKDQDEHKKLFAKVAAPRMTNAYTCNAYVVKNENAPETEGHFVRFTFGETIKKLIMSAKNSTKDAETGEVIEGFNPFELFDAKNLIVNGVKGQYGPSYKDSCWSKYRGRIAKTVNGKLVPMTDAEITKITGEADEEGNYIEGSSCLFSLAEFEKTEENAFYKTADAICKSYKKNTGKDLINPAWLETNEENTAESASTDESDAESTEDLNETADDTREEKVEHVKVVATESKKVVEPKAEDTESFLGDIF